MGDDGRLYVASELVDCFRYRASGSLRSKVTSAVLLRLCIPAPLSSALAMHDGFCTHHS